MRGFDNSCKASRLLDGSCAERGEGIHVFGDCPGSYTQPFVEKTILTLVLPLSMCSLLCDSGREDDTDTESDIETEVSSGESCDTILVDRESARPTLTIVGTKIMASSSLSQYAKETSTQQAERFPFQRRSTSMDTRHEVLGDLSSDPFSQDSSLEMTSLAFGLTWYYGPPRFMQVEKSETTRRCFGGVIRYDCV